MLNVRRGMKLTAIMLASVLLLLASCTHSHETISSSKNGSATVSCAEINTQFTNGTPMPQIVAKLGRPYTLIITTTLTLPPEKQNQLILVYHFGPEDVLISSTGEPTMLLDERKFAGAKVVRNDL